MSKTKEKNKTKYRYQKIRSFSKGHNSKLWCSRRDGRGAARNNSLYIILQILQQGRRDFLIGSWRESQAGLHWLFFNWAGWLGHILREVRLSANTPSPRWSSLVFPPPLGSARHRFAQVQDNFSRNVPLGCGMMEVPGTEVHKMAYARQSFTEHALLIIDNTKWTWADHALGAC